MNEIDFSVFKQEVADEMVTFSKYLGQVFQILEVQKQAYETISRHVLELSQRVEQLEKPAKVIGHSSGAVRPDGIEL